MKALISSLNQQGKTVIWISHDMSEVAELARRVIVLEQGRIILDGDTADIFSCEDQLAASGLEIPHAARLVRCLLYTSTAQIHSAGNYQPRIAI